MRTLFIIINILVAYCAYRLLKNRKILRRCIYVLCAMAVVFTAITAGVRYRLDRPRPATDTCHPMEYDENLRLPMWLWEDSAYALCRTDNENIGFVDPDQAYERFYATHQFDFLAVQLKTYNFFVPLTKRTFNDYEYWRMMKMDFKPTVFQDFFAIYYQRDKID